MPPLVSIVIPHYLGDVLSQCLERLFRFPPRFSFEVIVVADQPYDDGSVARATARFPGVRAIATEGARGFAAACNRGIGAAAGRYLCLLNNDVLVTEGWLDRLVAVLQSDPLTAACAPKVHSLRQPGHFDYSGGAGGMMDAFGYPFTRGRVFANLEKDVGQYDDASESFWVSGCAMLLRREALDRTGGFDERLFMQMEEIDLCWRLRLQGYRVRVCPTAVVHHYGGYSLGEGSLKKAYLNHRNNLMVLIKNLSAASLAAVLPVRLGLHLATVAYGLLNPREWRHAAAAVGALLWVLAHPALLLRARWESQRVRRRGDDEIRARFHPRSIVWEYFALGRRSARAILAPGPRRYRNSFPQKSGGLPQAAR